jgi:hypothetical protein
MRNLQLGLLALYILAMVALLFAVFLRLNSEPVFWALYLLIVFLLAVIVFYARQHQLLAILMFDLFLFLLFNIQYPSLYQVDRDTGFESQYASAIASSGHWDPRLGTGYAENYYGYNPLLHFVLAFLTLATGISTDLLSKFFLIILLRILFLLLVFRILQEFFARDFNEISLLGLFLYVITPRLRIIYVSRRLMAALMILFALFCLLQARKSARLRWNILFMVFSFLVIIADHTLSILFGMLLLGSVVFYALLAVLPPIFKSLARAKAFLAFIARFILYAIAWLVWNIWVSPATFAGDIGYLSKLLAFFSSVQSAGAAVILYNASQQWLIYASQGLLALSAALVLLPLLKPNKLFQNSDFLTYFAIFSVPGLMLMLYLVQTKWVVLSNITIWLFVIPVSLFAGLLLYRLKQSRYVVLRLSALLLVLVFFAGSILLQYHPNVLFNKPQMLVELPEYKSQKIIDSAEWLSGYAPGSTVIGDRAVFDIYSTYYGFELAPDDLVKEVYRSNQTELEKRFLTRNILFGAYRHTAKYRKPEFIVVNRDLLFNESYTITITNDSLRKFENSKLLRKVYDNGNIIIYENLA